MIICIVKGEKYDNFPMGGASFEIMVSNERAARALVREAQGRGFEAWFEPVTVHGSAKEAIAEHSWILSK